MTALRQGRSWLLVALVAVTGATVIALAVASGQDDPAPSTGSDPAPSTGSDPAPSTGSDPGTPPDQWADVARGFGQTFTHTALGQEAWFSAMSSWLTDEQAAMYRDIPIDDIPSGTLQDVEVDDPGDGQVTRGLLTYDSGMVLEVVLVHVESAGGWLVASIVPA